MKTYTQIQQQIAKLEAEAEALRRAEVKGVVGRIKQAIEAYGLTPQDLFGRGNSGGASRRGRNGAGKTSSGPPRTAKAGKRSRPSGRTYKSYRDSEGNSWAGRGPRPQWLRDALANGKTLADFLV